MRDADCIRFLQWALPHLRMRWGGFRNVRRQVCRRVGRRVRELGLPNVDAYREYLLANPREWKHLDELCHVTISRFYRDKGVFEFLQRTVLPALVEQRAGRATIEAWCAGCASGEEPYTLVLIWRLALERDFSDLSLRVLATDIDETMLHRARAARYAESSLQDLPREWRQAAFVKQDGVFRLRREFRSGVTVRRHDIRHDAPGGPFDLVLCRNVAFTYFDAGLQSEVAARLAASTRPGGALVIGAHETLPDGAPGFESWAAKLPIYRRLAPAAD